MATLTPKEMKTLERLLAKSKVVEPVKKFSKDEIKRIEVGVIKNRRIVVILCDNKSLRITTVEEYLKNVDKGRDLGNAHAARLRKKRVETATHGAEGQS